MGQNSIEFFEKLALDVQAEQKANAFRNAERLCGAYSKD
jgi:hypothetical protein